MADHFIELEKGIYAALETYSNVHRGSGHKSIVTTHLYEKAREIVLDYLGLPEKDHTVIFCNPLRAAAFKLHLSPHQMKRISSREIGLPIGVEAVAISRKALNKPVPFQTGGGAARLIAPGWVVWEKFPDRYEPGTPAIVNVIALALALKMMKKYGDEVFKDQKAEELTMKEILYEDGMADYSGKELLERLRKTMIGHGHTVPAMNGEKPFINFDHSASTPAFRPGWESYRKILRQPAVVRQEIVREVRGICSEFLGAPADEYDLVFTLNTTEAINLVAESFGRKKGTGTEPVILSSLMEHSSNDLPWRNVAGHSMLRLTVDDEGFIDLKELRSRLEEYNGPSNFGNRRITLVAVSGESNVLGSFNDLEKISEVVHTYGANLLVDGAQLVPHHKVEMKKTGIDYLVFSGHKAYAPFGIGALIARKGLLNFDLDEMHDIHSSGEENTAGIAALGRAILLLQRIGMDVIRKEELALTKEILRGMTAIPGMMIYGVKDPDSPRMERKGGIVLFGMKGVLPFRLAKELALRGGIGTRFGCHCSHIMIKHLLKVPPFWQGFQRGMVILIPGMKLPGLVRISLGIENTMNDVNELIRILEEISGKSKKSEQTRKETEARVKEFVHGIEKQVFL